MARSDNKRWVVRELYKDGYTHVFAFPTREAAREHKRSMGAGGLLGPVEQWSARRLTSRYVVVGRQVDGGYTYYLRKSGS